MHNGLYYLDDGKLQNYYQKAGIVISSYIDAMKELRLQHHRLRHISFSVLSRLFLSLYNSCAKEQLVCDACEYAKHIRNTYPTSRTRSTKSFDVVHSDV